MAGEETEEEEEEEEEEEDKKAVGTIGAFWNKVKKQRNEVKKQSRISRIYSAGSNFYRLYVNFSEYRESYESMVAAEKTKAAAEETKAAAAAEETKASAAAEGESREFFNFYINKIISDKPEKITYMEEPLLPNNPFLIPFWYAFIDDCIHNVLGEEGNNCEEEIVSLEKTEAKGETKDGTTMILYSSQDADHFEWNILKEIFHKRNEHFIKFFNELDGRSEGTTGKNEFISLDWITVEAADEADRRHDAMFTDGNKQKYNCPEYHKNYRIDNGKYAGVVLKDIIRDIKLYYDNHRSTVFKFEINDEKLKYNEMVDKAKIAFFEMAKKGKEEEEEEEVVLAADVLFGLREPNEKDGAVRPAEEVLTLERAPKKPRIGKGNPRGAAGADAARAAAAGAAAAGADAARAAFDGAAAAGRAVARAMQRDRPPSRSSDSDRSRSPLGKGVARGRYDGGKKTRKHRKIKIPKFSKDKNKKNKKNRKQTKNKKHKKGKTFKKKQKKTKRKD